MGNLAARLVELCRRHAIAVTAFYAVLALGAAYLAATQLSIDTDLDKLISSDVTWRQQAHAFDQAFPQNANLLAIVIDGATPDETSDATAALAAQLEQQPDLFKSVRIPGSDAFFARNGLLFLPKSEVQSFADQLIAAQPLLGTLAADPSLAGVFGTLDLLAKGAAHGDIPAESLDGPFTAVADATEAALKGRYAPLSWQTLLSGRSADPRELRHFILVQPVLDYNALEPGERATSFIRSEANELGLTPARGVTVRITGDVALSDEQLASLSEGAGFSAGLSITLLCVWLLLALRAIRLVGAIIGTLIAGLLISAGFAALAVGTLNPISVAFAVLFVGIAVDFGIQFSVRYRAERFRSGDLAEALRRTATGIGGPLSVAAGATSVGFLAFVPTNYTGVSDLGLIAGVGMLIALALNLTLLPALLVLSHARGEPRPIGFRWAAPIDRFLLSRRKVVALAALIVALGSAATLPWLSFDFNPLDLQNRHSEAVSTLFELMKDPNATPYTIEILEPSLEVATSVAKKLDALPEVGQTVTLASFVPSDQDAKLAIIQDARTLLAPSLFPATIRPPPSDDKVLATIADFAKDTAALADKGSASARRLAQALKAVLARGSPILPALVANLSANAARRLDELRTSLSAEKTTLGTIPAEVKRDWMTPDGRARIEVFPKSAISSNTQLETFVAAVRQIAPNATGTPVTIQESADTVTSAFMTAGVIALAAIAVLLAVVLRRLSDVALVLAPLILAGLMTLATGVLVGLPLNYANIIALPLLLGIGVSFDIYFVMRWRSGTGDLLQSSTARAILFSALTTGTAFGSLALSNHPGTSEMGKLLTLALFYTLVSTFIVLPALLGPVKRNAG
ncbi:MAG TPA: MMPL family transporter [Stellaceae bacterium]|nr:MMPL family transporter [Stellaceae bacterium]